MADDSFSLDGKIAVVTGASQGIGRAIAHALASAGAAVAVTSPAQHHNDIDVVCGEIEAAGGRARGYDLDVRDLDSIKSTFARIASDLGGLDILVNNAGVRAHFPALEITEEAWDFVLAVNLKGTFFCAQAAAAIMIERGGGRIVNIASQLAVSSAASRAPYVASKGGVVSLTKSLAVEWVKAGITVNAVGPGPTATPMTAGSDAATDERLLLRSPLGRRLEPEEVAGAVVFLAGPAAAAITGQHLLVDGGWTAA
jgi:NAD(P)-dependent dehydrogenase (short-subunit alcohol dehydrogenase family)